MKKPRIWTDWLVFVSKSALVGIETFGILSIFFECYRGRYSYHAVPITVQNNFQLGVGQIRSRTISHATQLSSFQHHGDLSGVGDLPEEESMDDG